MGRRLIFERLVVILLLAVAISACRSKSNDWSPTERANADHFFASSKADIAATQMINAYFGPTPREIPESSFKAALVLERQALDEAQFVRDDVQVVRHLGDFLNCINPSERA